MLTSDDFLQARQAVRDGVVAQLDADPAAAHLVGDSGGGAGAQETVEDEVVGVGCDVKQPAKKCFGFRCSKDFVRVEFFDFFFCVLVIAYFIAKPYGLRHNTVLDFAQKPLQ